MHTRINISDWLIQEGYLVLKEKVNALSRLDLEMIDWTKTKAFAFGAYDCQIHINLKKEEGPGIVTQEEYGPLMEELAGKLKALKGNMGETLKTQIFKKPKNFQGKYENIAPDMIIYFDNLEYGSNTTQIGNAELYSKQTALGSDSAAHSEQGIFIMAPSNKKGPLETRNLIDVFPTILKKLRIDVPNDIQGKSVD